MITDRDFKMYREKKKWLDSFRMHRHMPFHEGQISPGFSRDTFFMNQGVAEDGL